MKTKTIGFIGGGRITKILLQACMNKSVQFENVKVFDPNQETLNALQASFPEIVQAESAKEAAGQEIVVLAVHPPVMGETLGTIKDDISESTLVLSLAPKVTIEKIAGVLGTNNIVRMIPNATSYINKGFNPMAFHPGMDKKERKQFKKQFKSLGKNFEVEESKLEGYAIVSAMLPTYFWFQWEEMQKVALQTGLGEKEAKRALKNTLKKSISLFFDSKLTAEEVMDLIPVKPIGENEQEIREILDSKLMGLFNKIKP